MTGNNRDWLGLNGKTAVVTGAGGGIGRAIAVAMIKAGAKVVLLERNEALVGEAAKSIAEADGNAAHCIACDVADPASVEAAAAQSLALAGRADILVNNAALMRPGSLETVSHADWNAMLAVNLGGYLLCAQAFGRQMRDNGTGAIVNIASISGSHPQGQSCAYSASKAAIIMLSQQLATEWGPAGIRSNVVSPGMIETPLTRAIYDTPGVRERRSAVVPVRRIGQPSDIADAVLFLASPRASYVNGAELTVDGGYTRMLMNLIPRPGYDS